jgi:hypothetical protein
MRVISWMKGVNTSCAFAANENEVMLSESNDGYLKRGRR